MVLSKFKHFSDKILRPFVKKIGLTPNKLTIIGFCFSTISLILLLFGTYLPQLIYIPYVEYFKSNMLFFAGVSIIISGVFDALDGVLAREKNMVSKSGAFLDSVLDRYSDSFVILGIIIMGLCDPFFGILALVGCIIVSYTRARAESVGVKEMISVGIAERAERMLILSFSMMIQGGFWGLHCLGITNVIIQSIAQYTLLVFTIPLLVFLTHFTVLQRIIFAFKELKTKSDEKNINHKK
ncbi:MAG: CDP-alcohol phosphatidyltransferase family protein [Candidatus Helarchaeota archaeon]